MGAKKTNMSFSVVKDKPIRSFINSSERAPMAELQQMSSNKANTPSAVSALHQQLFKSSHCDRNNIMQVSVTVGSRGKELAYLMCNHNDQINWFLMHKSLNFRALSTPSRAGGCFFFFFNPFSRLAFLPNSLTSMFSNTWKAGKQHCYHICKEKQLHLWSKVTGICSCVALENWSLCGGGLAFDFIHSFYLIDRPHTHETFNLSSVAHRSSVTQVTGRGRTQLPSKFPITERLASQH